MVLVEVITSFLVGLTRVITRNVVAQWLACKRLDPHTRQGKVMLSFEWIALMSALSFGSGH